MLVDSPHTPDHIPAAGSFVDPARWLHPEFCTACPVIIERDILQAKLQNTLAELEAANQRIEELVAKVRLREQQLFGKKSEKQNKPEKQKPDPKPFKKNRGQQPGSQGHGRRDHSHLPAEPEVIDIPNPCCPNCHHPFLEFPGTEDSEILEIDVKAHRRIIKRKRYTPTCTCSCNPGIVTAPPPLKVIPKTIYGISVWVQILLDKYLFLRPTYRLLEDLKTHELDLPQGTLTGGLKVLQPLFVPVYHAIIEKNRSEERWHADETRWSVFCAVEKKAGYNWYMWTFISQSTVVYVLDPSRSAKVPNGHFQGVKEGILNVDRYSAYKVTSKLLNIMLAFCWAHVRRDFLQFAASYIECETWAMSWVNMIAVIYHINHLRLEVLNDPDAFALRDDQLRQVIELTRRRLDLELIETDLHPAAGKVLRSLKNHWDGLTVFVDHPEVPMDNNIAEEKLRSVVTGRKSFYGSFSLWSGELAAMLFTIFKTIHLWGLNPRLWMNAFLQACAENGGKALENVHDFLPWNMSAEKLRTFGVKSPRIDSS